MEPERKIEKLLRAYAEKRRAAAGDPLKPESDEASLSLWQLFRQQWAFLLGFALMVFLGAIFLLPSLGGAKRKAQSVSAMNNLKQIGVAAQMVAGENNGRLPASLDELTNGLVSRQILTDPVSGKPFVYLAGGEKLDDLQSNVVLAYSPADKDRRAVLLADGRVEYADRARFAALTNQKSTELALAKNLAPAPAIKTVAYGTAPAASPASTLGVASEMEAQGGRGAMQSFVQTADANQQNLYRNTSPSAQTAPVLQSFQMVQNGGVVSVVDRDGSVYQGSVQAAATGRSESMPMVPPAQRQATADQSTGIQQPVTQNYFFRVAGTNRTLRQAVVFSGTFEAAPGAITNAPLSFEGATGGAGVVQNGMQVPTNQEQSLLSNARVVGTAVIDQTNRIEINAVPVAQ
jgi:hypothetical protein